MIVFNLVCSECEYPFEGWFDDTKSFNSQKNVSLSIALIVKAQMYQKH